MLQYKKFIILFNGSSMAEDNKKKQKHVPVRMCSSCRKRKDKKDLLRIAKFKKAEEVEVKVDKEQIIMGRGMYLCYDLNCLKKLKKIKPKNRGFLSKLEENIYNKIEMEIKGSGTENTIESRQISKGM